ncbi:MAG: hypothetical protein KAI85_03405 [Halopseudomonas aestusnigri]|nr:hypothetical protein [Halopseudomonas aestusnigri]
MSKQITSTELAEIVTRLLTDTAATGQLDSESQFSSFMTDIAEVVCNHCGGEVFNDAELMDDEWYVAVRGNDALPEDSAGIWADYDIDGELFSNDEPSLLPYRVYLGEVDSERGGFFDDIWFECQAENLAHAVEQAKDAYPGCLINYSACYCASYRLNLDEVETVCWNEDMLSGFQIRLEKAEPAAGEQEYPETDGYCFKLEEWWDGDIVDTFYDSSYQKIREAIGQDALNHLRNQYFLVGLSGLWSELNAIPVRDGNLLDAPFLFFPKGTDREDILNWFYEIDVEFTKSVINPNDWTGTCQIRVQ